MSNFQKDIKSLTAGYVGLKKALHYLKHNSLTKDHYRELKEYVNEVALGGEVDLSIYEKVSDVDLKLSKKVDSVLGKDLSTNDFSNQYKSTLDNLSSNYYNITQSNLLLFNKVDKVEGKGLSSNDFTNSLKYRLENDVATKDLLDYKADLDYLDNNFVKKYQIANFATKDEIPVLTDYAKLTDIPNLEEYALKNDVPTIEEFNIVKERVFSIMTTEAIELQFGRIAETIRELDLDKIGRNEILNEFVTVDEFLNSVSVLTDRKAEKTELNDFIKKVEVPIYHKAVVQAVDGIWSYTFPSGLFTETPHIVVTAINDEKSSKNRANFASLDAGFSATSCAGIAKSCVSGGALVAMEMGNVSCPVHILAIQFP